MSTTPRNNRRRKSSLLSKTRWAGYAAAGAATALGTYEAAEAGITYSGLLNGNDGIKMNAVAKGLSWDTQKFDFNNDSIYDLRMVHYPMSYKILDKTYDAGIAGANSMANHAGDFYGARIAAADLGAGVFAAVRFSKNQTIDSAQEFFHFATMASSTADFFKFSESGEGFVGFSFDTVAGTHYGWLRVIMDGGPVHSYSIMDWAYADPGEGILAGVPEPGSLGLLATGGIGLLLWRKRRANRKSA